MSGWIRQYLLDSAELKKKVGIECLGQIEQAITILDNALSERHKVLLCGNGGSAADCQHIAAELVCSLRNKDRAPLPAIALTTDSSILTAYSNDYHFDGVFERQVDAIGFQRDVLWAISTSGKSPNIVLAIDTAKSKRMKTILLTGQDSTLVSEVESAIVVPSRNTQLLQEAFLSIEHCICMEVERRLFGWREF